MKPEIAEAIKSLFGTLGFLFVLLPIFLALIPFMILTSPNHANLFGLGEFRYFGVLPIVMGVIVYLWCSFAFVFTGKGTPIHTMPPKKFVVKGLYRYVRNPMYLACCLVLTGETLLFQSQGLLIYLLIMFGIFNIRLMVSEEPALRQRFGESYIQYCKSVSRWIPRLTPYQEEDIES
jgi:protein-S-isoprenylcysteine O-methyltransferase Ste14